MTDLRATTKSTGLLLLVGLLSAAGSEPIASPRLATKPNADQSSPTHKKVHDRPRSQFVRRGPQPGDVYREYATNNGGGTDWRVTDPTVKDPRARAFLPNPVLRINIDDLKGAVRAEALLDRWGGHTGTTSKRIRFNGHDWITVPELSTTPARSRPEMYYFQDNPVVSVPLDHLKVGENTFAGTCGPSSGWGQWGLYSLILRIYYDRKSKPHVTGRIVSPATGATLAENPTVKIENSSAEVKRVDVLAWYDGFDADGNGVFDEWHESYHQPSRGAPAGLRDHVGTITEAPYQATWNTRFVPDQQPGSVNLIARVQDTHGIWSVTPVVTELSLVREGYSVKVYTAVNVPERFGVRVGQSKSCTIPIPPSDSVGRAEEARLHLRTWHGWDGHHAPFKINEYAHPNEGNNHHYDHDVIAIPTSVLKSGDNVFQIHSETRHHMLEVLWPGPAITVRYKTP